VDNNKIGKFIANRRKELGYTQQSLADKLYVTDKAISKWERGLSLPDITLLRKLAKILKVDVIDILDGQIGTTKKISIEKDFIKLIFFTCCHIFILQQKVKRI
jgi:transcriptional regulator with XRE-family HTH domain